MEEYLTCPFQLPAKLIMEFCSLLNGALSWLGTLLTLIELIGFFFKEHHVLPQWWICFFLFSLCWLRGWVDCFSFAAPAIQNVLLLSLICSGDNFCGR